MHEKGDYGADEDFYDEDFNQRKIRVLLILIVDYKIRKRTKAAALKCNS